MNYNRYETEKTVRYFLLHYWYLILTFLVVILAVNLTVFFLIKSEKTALLSEQNSIRDQEISTINFQLNTVVTNVDSTINIINNANEMKQYLNDTTSVNLNEAIQLCKRISTNESNFMSISLVNISGQELGKVENIDGDIQIVSSQDLTNISSEYYYSDLSNLLEGDLYISNLEVTYREIQGNMQAIPELDFAVPTYDDNHIKQGYLVIAYNAYEILSLFNTSIDNTYSFTEFGILSNDVLFQYVYDQTEKEYSLVYEGVTPANFLSDSTLISNPQFDNEITDILKRSSPFVQIYTKLDIDSLYREKGSVIFQYHEPIMVGINFLIIIMFVVIFIQISRRQKDRTLYLGVLGLADKHENAIFMADYMKRIIYINESYENLFGFNLSEVKNKLLSDQMDFDFSDGHSEEYVWVKTKTGIYILSYFTLKPVKHFTGFIQYYIGEYAMPSPMITNIFSEKDNQTDVEKLNIISKAVEDRKIICAATSAFLFDITDLVSNRYFDYVKYTRINMFNYLHKVLGEECRIIVPNRNYFIIIGNVNLSVKSLEAQTLDMMDMMDEYLSKIVGENYKHYLISADYCRKENPLYKVLIKHLFYANEALKMDKIERYNIFKEDMTAYVDRVHTIENQLEYAFNHDEFHMDYQLQKDIDTDSCTGVEALLRWNNHIIGSVPPYEFISKIEKSQFIGQFTSMVLGKVINDLEPLVNLFPEGFHIAINLTVYDFRSESVIHQLLDIIDKSSIPSHFFCFEITENDYLENLNEANRFIKYLHNKSIIVAIDDFGTGYSSLRLLKELHVDKIKIDRTFIKDYPGKDDGSVFRTMVTFAKNLNLSVLAEGIETEEQVAYAKSCGVNKYQGFLISKPVPINTFKPQFKKAIKSKS